MATPALFSRLNLVRHGIPISDIVLKQGVSQQCFSTFASPAPLPMCGRPEVAHTSSAISPDQASRKRDPILRSFRTVTIGYPAAVALGTPAITALLPRFSVQGAASGVWSSHCAAFHTASANSHATAKATTEGSPEASDYDYWGLERKAILTSDGRPWRWNCFTPDEAYHPNLSTPLDKHWKPKDIGDRVAKYTVKFLRFWADLFFQKRYGCRAMMLETVAAVPGMVAAMVLHLESLRRFVYTGGWVKTLLEEAENERMHLMTFMEVVKPAWYERALVFTVQGIFFNAYFFLYLVSPKTCHRIVGYLEEEAVVSYTQYLDSIDSGLIKNVAAPPIAIDYWKLPEDATLRDVVLVIRADEAHHRDVNHFAANIRQQGKPLRECPSPLHYH